jgi:rfaE bifunctional protein kinase chain/domain
MSLIEQLFGSFSNFRVSVIGDVMLDTYLWGHVERISPEAPVPIVTVDRKEQRIGGAGNVALNLVALGARTSIFSVIGADSSGNDLTTLFNKNNIDTEGLVVSRERITTEKTRIISRNQQMLRLDQEHTDVLSSPDESALLQRFEDHVRKNAPDVVIFEDYDKGVLTPKMIRSLLTLCQEKGIFTAVDPKRRSFFDYQGVGLFKPNLKEVREALNKLPEPVNLASLSAMHGLLEKKLSHSISLITLSEHGIFYQKASDAAIMPSHVRNIADVSGAGDTVIAVAALVYRASNDVRLMAALANLAGGLVCEEVGTVAINKQKLLREAMLLPEK